MKTKRNKGQFTKKNARKMGSKGGKATFALIGKRGMSELGKMKKLSPSPQVDI